MTRYIRYGLLGLLVFFVVAYPTDSAELTRRLLGVTINAATGMVQVVWTLRVIVLGALFVVLLYPPMLKWLVARTDLAEDDQVKLMVAYIGSAGVVYGILSAILLIKTAP